MAFLLFACLGSLLTFSDAAGCTEADSDSCTDWSTNASSFIQVKDVRSKVVIEKHLLMDDEQDSKKKEQSTIGLEEHDEIRDPQAAEKGKKEKRKEQIEQDRKKEKHDVKEAGQSTIGTVQKKQNAAKDSRGMFGVGFDHSQRIKSEKSKVVAKP